jgi:tetratricopeptide (TPR) repeat protein
VRSPNDRLLYLTALVFGFGLTNYQVLLLLIVSLVLVVLLKDLALFRDFVIAGAPYVVVYYLIQKGALPKISHPTDTVTYIYGGLNFLALGLAYALLPHGRCVAPTILFAELGVSVYVFMPLASETNPPINWGYPRTWEGFLHALTRGQYERIAPTSMFSAQFVRQFGDYLSDLRSKFTLPVALLGTLPFTAWSARVGAGRVRALYASIALSVVAVCLITVEEFVMPTGVELRLLSQLYRVLIFLVAVLMGIGGAALLIGRIREFAGRLADARAPLSEKLTAGCVLLAGTAAVAFYAFVLLGKLVDPALQGDPKTRAGILVLLLAPAAIAGLVAYLMLGRARLELEMDAEGQKWVIGTLAGFAVMSMVLIVLANPKGDIQDEFIQRVKFISSHALFAFWIGYGLVFGLAYADNITRGNRLVKWAGIGVTLLLPVIPLLQNAYNQELLRTDGGAEMYGHDFGWQFGNYQLRGAPALLEELSPDEEPLPNPAFPPEMGPRAVFFGGTDPGRFVPTYMIYCADVRSDVYLITQNALADNTYMSVMRDLYGDTIWIPSVVDGNFAFQKYVEDVRAGRVPASADIKIENGRVSVQGVGGVMLINGILAQMIFEHNKAVHDFYVEESYVIQWMYPYLTPHGLIMKINRDPLPTLPADVVRDDMDFWDWYTRRLTGDVRFQRDVVARKSFSKLRSAIAGVYAVRGQFAEAERSFLDALELYPLSPEANFRLADLYTRWNRFDDAIRVMEEFARQDPNNDRAGGFANELKNRRDLTNRRKELEAELASGKASVGRALDLADVYRKMGLQEPFMALTRSLLDNPEMPPPVFLRLAQLYIEEKKFDLVVRALEGYVARVPADMKGWLDLTAVQAALQKTDDALRSAQQAVRVGGEAARNVLREDKRFDLLRSLPAFRALAGSATPLLLAP